MLVDLATAAFQAAYAGDDDEAWRHVVAIARSGGPALQKALLIWVDKTIDVIGVNPGDLAGFAFEQDGSGEPIDIDEALPEVAWAGRMFAARANNDGETWRALLGTVPTDAATLGRYIWALLTIMATTAAATDEDADEDAEPRTCCVMHAMADSDPDVAAARRAVAYLN
jgi:hypothetical protein